MVNWATNNDAYVRAAVPWQTGRGQETARHTTRRDRTGQSAERGRCTVVVAASSHRGARFRTIATMRGRFEVNVIFHVSRPS